MTGPNGVPDGLLAPIEAVVRSALRTVPDLSPDRIMLVGAQCRDVLHASLGHSFSTTTTHDLDLALAPPTRPEPMSVWAFEEVHAASQPLNLTQSLAIRVPTVPGYAALKLAAWLDRSEWREDKDAPDLAPVAHWYASSLDVEDRLYDPPTGVRPTLGGAPDYHC